MRAQQWVIWNTKLFGDQIAKIEGWNFEVNAWKWFNLEEVKKEDVIVSKNERTAKESTKESYQIY